MNCCSHAAARRAAAKRAVPRCRLSVRPSVRLSHRSAAATAADGFAAERQSGRRHRSMAAGALQQAPCSRRRRSAPNAGSVMLRADGGGSAETCRHACVCL